jgi:hypothetical protein
VEKPEMLSEQAADRQREQAALQAPVEARVVEPLVLPPEQSQVFRNWNKTFPDLLPVNRN